MESVGFKKEVTTGVMSSFNESVLLQHVKDKHNITVNLVDPFASAKRTNFLFDGTHTRS